MENTRAFTPETYVRFLPVPVRYTQIGQKRASGKWKIFPGASPGVRKNEIPIRQASYTLALVSGTCCLPWDTG